MRHCLFFSFLLSIFTSNLSATDPWRESFDLQAERARVRGLINNYPMPNLRIDHANEVNTQARQFLTHFETKIWPKLRELPELTRLWWDPPGGRIEVVNNALNRALYETPDEEKAWQKAEEDISLRYRSILSSTEWQSDVAEWARLAGSFKGELPDLARRMKSDLDINEFTPAELPLFEEIERLGTEIKKIARSTDHAKDITPSSKETQKIMEAFHTGKLSFSEASTRLEALINKGYLPHGREIAEKGEALFKRKAILRTQLAKRKGHPTWGSYVLSTYARHHREGLKTIADWKVFLNNLLTQTEKPWKEFLDKRTSEFGITTDNITASQLSLMLLPGSLLIRKYFPVENVEKFWRETMKESGFPDELFEKIHLDMYERPGKHTHAYLSYNVPDRPRLVVINALTLSTVLPPESDKSAWIPAALDIIQNMRTDGMGSYETMLHEGGHALHHGSEEDIWGQGASNAWAETHSMTMERFTSDPDFLVAKGRTKEGEALDRAQAERAIREDTINALYNLRRLAAQSLLDLELWDYDYEAQGAESFNDRLLRLTKESNLKASLVNSILPAGIDTRYRSFATEHFYSGDCRYWGYAGAEVAAYMIGETLLDELEKETGRRSFLNQPTIAAKLVERLYRHGHKKPFPMAVEEFTGKSYSPSSVVNATVKAAASFQPKTCGNELAELK